MNYVWQKCFENENTSEIVLLNTSRNSYFREFGSDRHFTSFYFRNYQRELQTCVE